MARTSDAKLIQGAGVAYKNWENDPAIYAGLDKVIKKGGEKVDEYLKAYELEKQNQKATKESQDKNWDKVTEDTYANLGGLSESQQTHTRAYLESTQQELYLAQNNKDKEGERKAFNKLNEEITYIQNSIDLKKSWSGYTDEKGNKIPPLEMSAAMNNSGIPGGNNGKQKEILTHWMENKSEVIDNSEEGKERLHTGTTPSGHEYSMTTDEIEALFIPNDPTYVNQYNDVYDKYSAIHKFNRTTVERKISQAIPKEGDVSALRAFMADDNFAGENFASLLDNDYDLQAEVETSLKNDVLIAGDDGKISDDEFLAFKKAITDPYDNFWLDADGEHDKGKWEEYARNIVVDRLFNAIENENIALKNPDVDEVDEEDIESNDDFETTPVDYTTF